jgi:hypothetical protein
MLAIVLGSFSQNGVAGGASFVLNVQLAPAASVQVPESRPSASVALQLRPLL